MADLKYVFEVDDKDILTSIKNHKLLEKQVVSLTKQYKVLDANQKSISIQEYGKAVQQLDQKIAHLEATLKKGGSAVNQLATGMNISGKATRNMELQFQQAGYQLQDFIVQVQGGVNPLIAFSQQGSQLAGFFAGPWGAAIGLGIAAMSSLAMVMLSTSEETSKTVDVFKELTEATRQLYLERMKLVDSKFDENLQGTEEELKRLTEAYEKAKREVESYNSVSNIGTPMGVKEGLAAAQFLASFGEASAKAALEKAEADLKAYNIEKNQLLIAETQATIDEQNANRRIAYQDAYFQKLREEAEKRKEISDKIGEAYLSAIGLQQQPMDAGINKAAAAAQVLAERLGISLNAARNIVALEAGKGFQAKDYSSQAFGGALADMRLAGSSTPPVIKEAIASSGGGGSRVAQIKQTTVAIQKETEANKLLEENMNTVSSNMTSAFMSMVDGSNTVVGAFRNMMYNILKSIYEQNVAKPLGNSISSLLFAGLSGGGPQTGSMGLPNFRFADGGVVGSPTTFQMSGGKTGLMGEAGPEAIMPLKRGSNGQLGVQVQGGSGGMTVNNNITVTGSDAAAVRMEVAKMIPQITNATKAAIIDAKKRGGQMGAAFA